MKLCQSKEITGKLRLSKAFLRLKGEYKLWEFDVHKNEADLVNVQDSQVELHRGYAVRVRVQFKKKTKQRFK